MAELCTKQQRKQVEDMLYKLLDQIDHTHTNSDYYRQIFANMSNDEFFHFFERRLPIRFHYDMFKIEPVMPDIIQAFKILNTVPLFEKINVPHIYRKADGTPVQTEEAMTIYIHDKRLKQMVIEKSHVSMNTEKRDMKTGLLTAEDKGAKETDREFESLAAFGLEYTMDEFARPRADSMRAAAEMNSVIMTKGSVSDKDIVVNREDSLAKNLLNTYLIGAHIHSNLLDSDYMTPYTLKNKQRQVERV